MLWNIPCCCLPMGALPSTHASERARRDPEPAGSSCPGAASTGLLALEKSAQTFAQLDHLTGPKPPAPQARPPEQMTMKSRVLCQGAQFAPVDACAEGGEGRPDHAADDVNQLSRTQAVAKHCADAPPTAKAVVASQTGTLQATPGLPAPDKTAHPGIEGNASRISSHNATLIKGHNQKREGCVSICSQERCGLLLALLVSWCRLVMCNEHMLSLTLHGNEIMFSDPQKRGHLQQHPVSEQPELSGSAAEQPCKLEALEVSLTLKGTPGIVCTNISTCSDPWHEKCI